ncbi:hypothetical protein PFLUV_G00164360 [Perca fluviatilis]|uniref:Uncharacterized protein n=1 Tax=Perca fluviatilis TaxID=8168 RepID=A0A6A5EXW0_PERFL|nr:hypothetical protein PFLUV_G00164360 [Perca fluviatilis]
MISLQACSLQSTQTKFSSVVLKADRRKDFLPLEWEGQPSNRLVSTVYIAAEEEVKGWFSVSDYTDEARAT